MNFGSLLQEHIDTHFGGCYFYLPADHSQCSVFRDLGISESFRIKYSLFDPDGLLIDHCEQRVVGASESLLLSPSSWFTDVVLTSLTAQSLLKKKRLPNQLVNQAVRQLALSNTSLLVTPFAQLEQDHQQGLGFPEYGYLGPQFSVSFWLYVESRGLPSARDSSEDPSGRNRQILFKGNSRVRQFDLCLSSSRRRLSLCFNSLNSPSSRKLVDIPHPIKYDAWFSCGFSFGHNRLEVYIDGSLVHTDRELQGPPCIVTEPLFFGRLPAGFISAQDLPGISGAVRDLRFFNRPLSDEEIGYLGSSAGKSSITAPWPITPLPSTLDTSLYADYTRELESWTVQMDSDFVRLCHELCEKIPVGPSSTQDPFHVPVDLLEFTEKSCANYIEFARFPAPLLRLRFAMLRLFNLRLANIFSLIDFSQSQISWSLASSLFEIKGYIFTKTKMAMWLSILARTSSRSGSNNVRLNRHSSHKAREKGDPECKRSVFGQLFQQLHFIPPDRLRGTGQTWRVELVAEGGQDAGGVFRDSISHLCTDLQSTYLPLLVPVPNKQSMSDGQQSSGFENWHLWIPNTSSVTPYQLRMYAFVGKLMGIAIRAKHLLNLDIPPLIWKLLVGQTPLEADVAAIDTGFVNNLRQLRGLKPLGQKGGSDDWQPLDQDGFEALEMNWEVTSWLPGQSVPLIENGSQTPLKWEERFDYCEKALQYRLNAFAPQIEAIRKGMAAIIPIALLPLFTWQELELQVCGKRELDLDLLKRNTSYVYGVSKDDPHVALHWQMLENFSPREQELFLRFVWGRGRLPIDDASFTQKYQIMSFSGGRGGKDENFLLPKSHTCFFQLELPRYRTLDQMTKMIRVAIENCVSIDDDGTIDASAIESALQVDD